MMKFEIHSPVIRTVATQLVLGTALLNSNKEKERDFGYLFIMNHYQDGSTRSLLQQIGKSDDKGRLNRYKINAQEKAFRLRADNLREPNVVSSWYSRDATDEVRKYGGAVLFGENGGDISIISFSGLLEHVDETVSLSLGEHFGLASKNRIEEIVDFSRNPVYQEMRRAISQEVITLDTL